MSSASSASINPAQQAPGLSPRVHTRTHFQLASDLLVSEGQSAREVFDAAIQLILDWFSESFQRTIPDAVRRHEDFELERTGRVVFRGVSIPERGIWSTRLICAETALPDGPLVPGQSVDMALRLGEDGVRLALRSFIPLDREPHEDPPPVLDVLSARIGLLDVRRIGGQPWMLQTPADLQALHELLLDRRRAMPVILLTQTDPAKLQTRVGKFMLPPEMLARRLRLQAHVVCLPRELSYSWTDMVGKPWSAFLGAVRTYHPQLNFETDELYAHPLVMADKILFWRWNDLTAEDAFMEFLVSKVGEQTVRRSLDLNGVVFDADARQLRAELERARIEQEIEHYQTSVKTVDELTSRLDRVTRVHAEELAALRERVQQLTDDLEVALQMGAEAAEDANRSRSTIHHLQLQNDALRQLLERKGAGQDQETPIPPGYEGMAEWVETHLVGRLMLHPRAERSLADAQFEDAPLIYRCLLLLAGHYRNMKRGIEGAKAAFEQELATLGLRHGPSISRERAGEHGDHYFIQHAGRRHFIESHLRNNGNTRDPRRCLAIYFLWHEESQQVIICSLPAHLPIAIS